MQCKLMVKFDFSRTDVEATLSSPEEIREDLINLYEKMCYFLPMVNEKMRFLFREGVEINPNSGRAENISSICIVSTKRGRLEI